MTLTEEDKKKISDWINEKCGQMRCTCCGYGQWELLGSATLPIGFDVHTTRFYYHQGIPQITIACVNCGHMLFFNPAIMGFKPDAPEEKEIDVSKDSSDKEVE